MPLSEQIGKILSLLDRRTHKQLVGLFFLMLVGAVLEMIGLGLFLPILQVVSKPEGLSTTPIIKDIYAMTAPDDPQRFFLIVTTSLFVFYIVKNTFLGFMIYIQNRFVMTKQAAFSRDLMETYLRRPYLFYLSHNSAEILRNINDSGGKVFFLGLLPMLTIALEFLLAAGTVTMLVIIEPWATITVGLVLGLSGIAFFNLLQRRIVSWGKTVEFLNAEIIKWVHQSIGPIKQIMVSGREFYFRDRFAQANFTRARARALVVTSSYLPRLFIEVVIILSMLLVTCVIIWRGQTLQDVVPVLGIFAVGAFRLVPSASRIVTCVLQLKEGVAPLNSIYDDFMDRSEQRSITREGVSLPFTGKLAFEQVSFHYPAAKAPSINDISLEIQRGDAVGFVGPSGAGKTTAVDIILGLIAPTSGRMTIDGIDVRGNIRSWQDRIGFVPQSIYLIDDTLRRNIALGVPDDEIDEQAIRSALGLAQLDTVLSDLTDGLDTLVGENGIRLSGGQRQRIGIARALYHNPDVLVLDEATSSMDAETEHEISNAIGVLAGIKTIIIIAHRMSTVKQCRNLFFLKHGRLVDTGTFEQLSSRNRDFQRMIEPEHMETAEIS